MRVGILRDRAEGERRVALVPESVKRLVAKQHEVFVETGAGAGAGASDGAYAEVGGRVQGTPAEVVAAVDVALKVHAPNSAEVELFGRGKTIVSLLYPTQRQELVRAIAARGGSAIALDAIPRTTYAQMMDVLSSQATLAGYRAVLIARRALAQDVPDDDDRGRHDRAGARAGARRRRRRPAGDRDRAAARRDRRGLRRAKIAKEQVESLGAKFVEVDEAEDAQAAGGYAKEVVRGLPGQAVGARRSSAHRQGRRLHHHRAHPRTARADPHHRRAWSRAMRPGSVIVDLAAEQGGNCELTRPGERSRRSRA